MDKDSESLEVERFKHKVARLLKRIFNLETDKLTQGRRMWNAGLITLFVGVTFMGISLYIVDRSMPYVDQIKYVHWEYCPDPESDMYGMYRRKQEDDEPYNPEVRTREKFLIEVLNGMESFNALSAEVDLNNTKYFLSRELRERLQQKVVDLLSIEAKPRRIVSVGPIFPETIHASGQAYNSSSMEFTLKYEADQGREEYKQMKAKMVYRWVPYSKLEKETRDYSERARQRVNPLGLEVSEYYLEVVSSER